MSCRADLGAWERIACHFTLFLVSPVFHRRRQLAFPLKLRSKVLLCACRTTEVFPLFGNVAYILVH